jgi:hypothetical protein
MKLLQTKAYSLGSADNRTTDAESPEALSNLPKT